MSKYIISKNFENLTEVEKMILSIKGAIQEIKKNNDDKDFYGFFIVATIEKLKGLGIDKEDIFKYEFKF